MLHSDTFSFRVGVQTDDGSLQECIDQNEMRWLWLARIPVKGDLIPISWNEEGDFIYAVISQVVLMPLPDRYKAAQYDSLEFHAWIQIDWS